MIRTSFSVVLLLIQSHSPSSLLILFTKVMFLLICSMATHLCWRGGWLWIYKLWNIIFFFPLHLRVFSPALAMNPSLPRLGCTVVDWLLLYAKSLGNWGCLASVTLSWEDESPWTKYVPWQVGKRSKTKVQIKFLAPLKDSDIPSLSTWISFFLLWLDETQVSHKDNALGPALWTRFPGVGRILPSPL